MDRLRRTSSLRRVATVGALAALLVPAGTAEAAKKKPKYPVVTSVSPMNAKVGDTLLIKGKNFRTGKRKNSVGFKADGSAVVFVKSDVSTSKRIYVKVPSRLEKVMRVSNGVVTATRFRLRVLAGRLGKSFTSTKLSPKIAPAPPKTSDPGTPGGTPAAPEPTPAQVAAAPEGDCDGDGLTNANDPDDDNDLLSDARENQIGTDACKADTDGDGVSDGYEFRSAIDLNDDEYQSPNETTAAPVALGYPNPLLKDANVDYDGDGLPLKAEFDLWNVSTPAAQKTLDDPQVVNGSLAATPLSYSDGLQYSIAERCPNVVHGDAALCGGGDANRRVPGLKATDDPKWQDFDKWLDDHGYKTVTLHDSSAWFDHANGNFPYDIRDANRSGALEAWEQTTTDADGNGFVSDDERDEDADGLSNIVELRGAMRPDYWTGCYQAEPPYPVAYSGTDMLKADTDGDGIRDGADDQDHDDVPNVMELSRIAASGFNDNDNGVDGTIGPGAKACDPDKDLDPEVKRHNGFYGQVNPFNPCEPDRASRTCARGTTFGIDFAPFSGADWWSLQ